jgi:iron complex transport system substrate-binding protein
MPRTRYLRLVLPSIVGIVLPALVAAYAHRAPSGRAFQENALPERIEYVDGIGRHVELPRRPRRIISLAPSVTEVLYLIGANDRLIGVTTQCDWPDDAKRKPKIGSLLNPNDEIVLSAHPDLVIASTAGNDQAAVENLARLGLPVYVTAPRSVEGILATTREIGVITDCRESADRLAARTRARLGAIRQRLAGLPPVRAFFITWFDPLLAPGKRTFENDVLRLANVISISGTSDEYYPRYSLEQVVAAQPDVILTVRHEARPLPDLRNVAGWRSLPAVSQGRVYVLGEVFQHPSPRFVDGVEELVQKLYPERFR